MRYDEPATREALAAEYVLGSLRGAARRRFERLMAQKAEWRDEVERWSVQLAGFAATAPEIEPPPAVWSGIQARLEGRSAQAPTPGLRWWKTLAAVASIASIVLAIALVRVPEQPAIAPQVSVLKDPQARTGWVVTFAVGKSGRPELRVVTESATALPERAFELWALPGAGAPPVSLGLLPSQGETILAVSAEARPLLERGAALAVSVEPPGGSPTGQPTGPVVYQGRLIAL